MSKVIVDEIQTDTSNGNVRIIPNGTGKLEVKGAGGDDAMLQLNCSAQSHGVKIKSPAHSAGQSYTMILPDNNIEAGKFLKVKSIASGSGATAVGQLEYADAGGGGLSSDAQQNTVGGTNAGDSFTGTDANSNTLIGYNAGTAITTGDNNTCIGAEAGEAITTGYDNTFVGSYTGYSTTTAYRNSYLGYYTGYSTTTGNYNTAIGDQALYSCTTGSDNIAIGNMALYDGTGMSRCIGIGVNACKSASYGYAIGIGDNALKNNTSGANNVALGSNAGSSVTTGANNIFFGENSGYSTSPSGTITTGSNNIVLGNNNITNLYCADTSISSSDQRDKTDVTSFNIGLAWIEALRPVTYRWDRRTWYGTDEEPYGTPDGSKKRSKLHIGFLAQEALAVEQANGYGADNDNSLAVHLNEDGMSYGMKYERLVPILVNAIKELSARVKTLEGG